MPMSLEAVRPIGLDEIREACEARSLAEHVWDVAKAWDLNGAKKTHLWMLHAIGHFGDDEVVRRLRGTIQLVAHRRAVQNATLATAPTPTSAPRSPC